VIASPPPVYPWPIGPGPRYRPPAANVAVLAGRPLAAMRCSRGGRHFAVHVELFANRRVIVVPRRIGRYLPLRWFVERAHEFLLDGNHNACAAGGEIQISCHCQHAVAKLFGL